MIHITSNKKYFYIFAEPVKLYNMKLIPYVTFNGNCEEALNFYKDSIGGEIVSIGRYEDTPMGVSDDYKKKILHARIQIGSHLLMASDSMPERAPLVGNNISLSIEWDDVSAM